MHLENGSIDWKGWYIPNSKDAKDMNNYRVDSFHEIENYVRTMSNYASLYIEKKTFGLK